MQDGPLSFFKTWEGFLPPNAVVMAKVRMADEAAAVSTAAPIRFLVEAPGITRPADHELFEKMMGALGLTLADVCVEERGADLPEDFVATGARALLRFILGSNDTARAGQWEELARTNGGNEVRLPVLSTYSLEAILRDPGLKKAVWSHLKEASQR